MSGRNRPRFGPGICRVERDVRKAVEGHGGGASGNHGYDDPKHLVDGRNTIGSQHGSAESEGESKNGMLPLDHFQCDFKVVQHRHK